MTQYQVEVELHRLEARQAFAMSGLGPPQGPVVVTSARGQELGWIVRQQALSKGKKAVLAACRPANAADLRLDQERRLAAAEVETFARGENSRLGLSLNLLGSRQSLDGSWLVLYFSCPERVDFRELVKRVGQRFSRKVELYQLNARQRSQFQGGQGRCGRECCCRAWLREFPAVSVKLAEEQGLQLQPEAITGVCGRLLCCLRYEYESLLESRQNPGVGQWVETPEGPAQVLEVDPHCHTLRVRLSDDSEISIPSGRARSGKTCDSCQQVATSPDVNRRSP